MMFFALLLTAALGSTTAVSNEDPKSLPVETASAAAMPGFLHVHEGSGCDGGEGKDELQTDFMGNAAIFRQRIWLNLRESVTEGPVTITRDGDTLRVEVDTVVAPIEPGVPTPACIRPLELVLNVYGLPKGNYQVQFARRVTKP